MKIFVDELGSVTIEGSAFLWCRLACQDDDSSIDSIDNLTEFCDRLGLSRRLFVFDQTLPYYRINASMRDRALAVGAIPVEQSELERLCCACWRCWSSRRE